MINKQAKHLWIKWNIGLFSIVLLTSGNCRGQAAGDEEILKEAIGQVWIHSHEEDSADLRAYRAEGFDFPPSRGREGFQIHADSTFTLFGIAPTDGVQRQKGSWKYKNGRLHVNFEEQKANDGEFTMEFIGLKEGLLKARKNP